jgi:hypothetical protein
VGLNRLAEQAGVSVSTVRRGLAILVGMGLVAEQRKAKSGPGMGFKFDYRWQVCWGQVQGHIDDFQADQRQSWLQAVHSGDWQDFSPATVATDSEQEVVTDVQLATEGRTEASAGDAVKLQVGEILRDTSVVDKARAAGASDALIQEVVAVYQANRRRPENCWGPEALHYRLRELRPGQSPIEGWFKDNRISPPEVMQVVQAARDRERREFDQVSQRIQLIRYGRSRGASIEQINRALGKRGWDLLPVEVGS